MTLEDKYKLDDGTLKFKNGRVIRKFPVVFDGVEYDEDALIAALSDEEPEEVEEQEIEEEVVELPKPKPDQKSVREKKRLRLLGYA